MKGPRLLLGGLLLLRLLLGGLLLRLLRSGLRRVWHTLLLLVASL